MAKKIFESVRKCMSKMYIYLKCLSTMNENVRLKMSKMYETSKNVTNVYVYVYEGTSKK
jgi:hypothetical protein